MLPEEELLLLDPLLYEGVLLLLLDEDGVLYEDELLLRLPDEEPLS